MAKKTSKLKLTLPEKNEFQNGWHAPLNENFEEIDDYIEELEDVLVSTASLVGLKGTTPSLYDRLDVAHNADGTLKISASPEFGAIDTSATRGIFGSPQKRLNAGDEEAYLAKSPVPYGRFKPIPVSGHDPGVDAYLRADMDSGMALRSVRPNGLVVGPAPLIQAVTATPGQIRLDCDTTPAIFSIDGFIFHLREDLLVNFAGAGPLLDEYFWVYVERSTNGYADATMTYKPSGSGAFAAGDMRIIQAPAFSVILGEVGGFGTAVATGASFQTGQFKVLPGDLFVVDGSGDAAGSYTIKSVDSDTQITIDGVFGGEGTIGSGGWRIYNPAVPKIGLARAASAPTDPTSQPDAVNGRVYIGRCQYKSGAQVEVPLQFAAGGSFDSGWLSSVDAAYLAAATRTVVHNIGQTPSRVEIWFRANATSPAYKPIVKRQVVTNGATTTDLLVNSVHYGASETSVTIRQLNASTDPSKPEALFTDDAGTDVTSGQMRVMAWR